MPQLATLLFLCALSLSANSLSAQLENSIWFLGGGDSDPKTGIRFASGPPAIDPYNSVRYPLQLQENNIMIASPATGDIIFYSDGRIVVDGSHTPMPNGLDLAGSASAMYGTTVVLDPSSCNGYLIFSVEDETVAPPRRAHYSRVNLDLPGNGSNEQPLGDIDPTTKNISLFFGDDNAAEGIYALPKAEDSRESWVFIADRNQNRLVVYDVSATGISEHDVYSLEDFFPNNLPTNDPIFGFRLLYRGGEQTGDMILATARKEDNSFGPIGYQSFNRTTGTFSPGPATLIATDTEWTYGLALSPDGTKLYYSDYFQKRLSQYDFDTGELTIIDTFSENVRSGGLQNGPDGRVYWANVYVDRTGNDRRVEHLARINSPNNAGSACGLQYEAVTLPTPNLPRLLGALPTIGSFPKPATASLLFGVSCTGEGSAYVSPGAGVEPFTYLWDNDEITDTARQLTAGLHFVTVTSATGCQETARIFIEGDDGGNIPPPLISSPLPICPRSAYELAATAQSGGTILWTLPDGTNTEDLVLSFDSVTALNVGEYRLVEAVGDCQSEAITYTLELPSTVEPAPPLDTIACIDTLFLSSALPNSFLRWTDGNIDDGRAFSESGMFSYIFLNEDGCPVTGTINVVLAPSLVLSFPDSIIVDPCTPVTLDPGLPNNRQLNYQWAGAGVTNPVASIQQLQVFTNETYSLQVVDLEYGCVVTTSIEVNVSPNQSLYIPNAFSPNGDGVNDGFTIYHKSSATVIENLSVYDRWGSQIFSVDNIPVNSPGQSWQGDHQPQEEGITVFVFTATVLFQDGTRQRLTGDVILVR